MGSLKKLAHNTIDSKYFKIADNTHQSHQSEYSHKAENSHKFCQKEVNTKTRRQHSTIDMAKSVELYTTDFALEAQGASYKGLIIVNKVKSRNMFSDIGAGFKSMVGGEIKSMSKLTRDTRNELIAEAQEEAVGMGANAI